MASARQAGRSRDLPGGGSIPGRGSNPGGSSSGGFPGGGFPGGGFSGQGGRSAGGANGRLSGGGPSFGSDSTSLTAAARYARRHGGGTVGVESQSSAADAILAGSDNVAGLGGFSGVESAVSVRWLATEVRDGHLRWLLADSSSTGGPGRRGGAVPFGNRGSSPFGSSGRTPFGNRGGGVSGGRTGSEKAFAIAEKVARKVTITAHGTTITLYDLKGRAAAILAAADGSTTSSQTV